MSKVLNNVNYEVPDIQYNEDASAVVLKKGQTVQIRRVVTYVYDIDMSEWLDANGDSGVTVYNLVECETDNPHELESSDVEEDVVAMVTIL